MADLHVILNALFDHKDDQIDVEEWTIGNHRFRICLGNIIPRESVDVNLQPSDFSGFFECIETTVKGMVLLSPELHWIRVFVANMGDGNQIHEFLLDNEPHIYGQERLAQLALPRPDGYYSLRFFSILVPIEDGVADT
jgi:hypothetical protein